MKLGALLLSRVQAREASDDVDLSLSSAQSNTCTDDYLWRAKRQRPCPESPTRNTKDASSESKGRCQSIATDNKGDYAFPESG